MTTVREALRSREHRNSLVEQYLPLVHHIVGRLSIRLPGALDRDDLYSAGVLGLIHAAESYDSKRGATFKTYAFTMVRGAVLDEIRRHDPLPRGTRERIRRVERTHQALAARLGRHPSREELAHELDCSVDDLDGDLVSMHTAHVLSIDDADDGSEAMAASLPNRDGETPDEVVERREASAELGRLIDELPDQARQTVVLYYHEGLLLKEIGALLGVSESRACQVLAQAMARLRLSMRGVVEVD